MHSVSLEEAVRLLPQLIQEARSGEEVIITQDSLPVVRLVPTTPAKPNRQPGSAKGLILHMAEDFDAIPDGFEEYVR
jgi:prevent-host-death family protein